MEAILLKAFRLRFCRLQKIEIVKSNNKMCFSLFNIFLAIF